MTNPIESFFSELKRAFRRIPDPVSSDEDLKSKIEKAMMPFRSKDLSSYILSVLQLSPHIKARKNLQGLFFSFLYIHHLFQNWTWHNHIQSSSQCTNGGQNRIWFLPISHCFTCKKIFQTHYPIFSEHPLLIAFFPGSSFFLSSQCYSHSWLLKFLAFPLSYPPLSIKDPFSHPPSHLMFLIHYLICSLPLVMA